MKYKYIIVPDFIIDNQWGKCKTLIKGELYGFSRAYSLWKTINRRVNSESVHLNFPNYSLTKNEFEDFQDFASWCNDQFGYMNKETNGNYWSIEKDIRAGSNYNKLCLFVPNYINASVLDSEKIRGELPLGVVYRKKNKDMKQELTNCYLSNVKKDGKRIHLGYHSNAFDAHRAWQKSKIDIMREYIKREEVSEHLTLIANYLPLIERIEDDYLNFRETERII
jgi:hypothetical protein